MNCGLFDVHVFMAGYFTGKGNAVEMASMERQMMDMLDEGHARKMDGQARSDAMSMTTVVVKSAPYVLLRG